MKSLLPLLLALAACVTPSSQRRPQPEGGLALQGYDPVAYFAEGGGSPLEGEPGIVASYDGAVYRFASERHRELFLAKPERYVPLYGGWCAYAMADGEKVDVDPESYIVTDAGLYLFYDGLFGDTRRMWLDEGPDALRERADAAWQRLEEGPTSRPVTD